MPDQIHKYLIFSLGTSRYALDLKHIAEVSDPPQLWPIPFSSSFYHGALNFHGDIVAALHLPSLLGLTGSNQPQKIIVLHKDIASLALLVDTVVRIVSGEELSFKPSQESTYSAATLGLTDGEATLLDLDKLAMEADKRMRNCPLPVKTSLP